MDTVTATFVVLARRILVGLPFGDHERTLLSQGSPELIGGTDVSVTARDGNASGVSVGKGVCVGVSVGGNGVAVGIAAWVSATIVNAAATAVNCTSAALIVGAGSAPHAVMTIADITMIMERNFSCFMLLENLLI